MLHLNYSGKSGTNQKSNDLTPKEFLDLTIKKIRDERFRTLKRIYPDNSPYKISSKSGFLFIDKEDIEKCREFLSERGFNNAEIDDMIFTPNSDWDVENYEFFEKHFEKSVELAKTCCQYSRLSEDKVAIGLADISILNAGVRVVPKKGECILFNHGIGMIPMWFACCRQAGEVYLRTNDSGSIFNQLVGTAAIAIRMNNNWYVTGINRFSHNLIHSDSLKYELQRRLWDVAILFVILHEFGHIILGHSELLRKWGNISSWTEKEKEKRFRKMRTAEKEADIFALDLLIEKVNAKELLKFNHKPTIYSSIPQLEAICILFSSFHIVESNKDLADANKRTHPTSIERLDNILKHVANKYLVKISRDAKFIEEDIPRILNDIKEVRTLSRNALKKAGIKILSNTGHVAFEI